MQQNQLKPKATGLAENVPPTQVQQDRFFQKPAVAATQPMNKTRVVTPKNAAQALLKPVQQIAKRIAPNKTQPTINNSAFAMNQPKIGARVQQLLQPQPRAQSILEPQSIVQSQNAAAGRRVNTPQATLSQPAAQPVAQPSLLLHSKESARSLCSRMANGSPAMQNSGASTEIDCTSLQTPRSLRCSKQILTFSAQFWLALIRLSSIRKDDWLMVFPNMASSWARPPTNESCCSGTPKHEPCFRLNRPRT